MKLCRVDFRNIFAASGALGFFGEGYWPHKIWDPTGKILQQITFVSKTATLLPREGNMPLTRHYTPRDWFPECIKAKPSRGLMLNAVGLSNPGIHALLNTGKWQEIKKPFFISIMPVADTPEKRLEEIRAMIDIIGFYKDTFFAPFGLQINLSCPNTQHSPDKLIKESVKILEAASKLGVPLMPKYSIASAPIEAIKEFNNHPNCDAICVSNTLPFGWQGIDWQKVWGSKISPLAKYGGGGLSGKVLRPLVCEWIARLRDTGFTKPINGGGGIMRSEDVVSYRDAGASSVFIGSVAVSFPWWWNVKEIIKQSNMLIWWW